MHTRRFRKAPTQPANISQHWDGDGPAIPVAETMTVFSSLVLTFKLLYYVV